MAGVERGQGVRLKEGGTVPCKPRPSFYPSSPHTFSRPSWQQGSPSVGSCVIPAASMSAGSAPQWPGDCPEPPRRYRSGAGGVALALPELRMKSSSTIKETP